MENSDQQPVTVAADAPIVVVINAGSGAQGEDERLTTLRRVFDEAGRRHEIHPIEHAASITRIAEAAVARAVEIGGIVAAAGGDGTLNAVAQVAVEAGCVFGAIPQGTFNYFGRAHGIPQDSERAARALLRASVTPVQVGQVNGRIFLVNASLGLYPELLEDRETYKRRFGRARWVALLSGLATMLRRHRQLELDIQMADHVKHLRTPTLFVGNNMLQFERLGLDAAVDALERGQLAAVAMNPIGTAAMLGLALRGAIGRLGEAGNFTRLIFRRLTVHPRGHPRIKVATDGEIHWLRAPLVFEVAPRPLQLLVPVPEDRAEVA
jgi:diacylglycerol kinase family enzyme